MMRVAMMVVCLLVAAPARAGDGGEPRVPKLDGGAQPGPPSLGEPGGARRLPPTVAVCADASTQRCWIARAAAECAPAPAALFRLVIDEPGRPDVADALAACRDAIRP